jgi:beta-lactamase regulating signal transducer with metallopeptidase domain
MKTLLAYLWQANVVWTLLYAVYVFALQRDTFFNRNRAYLLATIFVALTLPLLPVLPTVQENVPTQAVQMIWEDAFENTFEDNNSPKTTAIIPSAATIAIENEPKSSFSIQQILLVLYVVGVLFFALRFANALWQVLKLAYQNGLQKTTYSGIYQVPISAETPVFVFLNILFWSENEALSSQERRKILLHELTHIRQLHTLDLLLIEVLQIIFWFNPVVYLSKVSLQTLHEYLADREAVLQTIDIQTNNSQVSNLQENAKKEYAQKEYAKLLVNQTFHAEVYTLSHSFFNASLLKKRIKMLQKRKTHRIALLKTTLIIPILGACIFLIACSKEIYKFQSAEIESQKKLMQTEWEYQHIKTFVPDVDNKIKFETADKMQYGISLVAVDGNYQGLTLQICSNKKGEFSEPFEITKPKFLMFFRKQDAPEATLLVLKNGKKASNVVVLIGEYDITKKETEQAAPPQAGVLQLSAKASQDPSEITITLRNDMDYAFEVTQGKAKLLFKETFGTNYEPDKEGVVKISPQKDIGGYLLIAAQEDAIVTMRYSPR